MKADPAKWLDARFAELRPKAIAAFTRQFRDLDLAEEAFSAACVKALAHWPRSGLPKDPFAWLLVAGRNAGIDQIRRSKQLHNPVHDPVGTNVEESEVDRIEWLDADGLRDDVLRLLFICCHPNLSRQDQLAVALKLVVGMATPEIGRAFLVKAKTMEQRITRAKKTIAGHPIPFETPDLVERKKRLNEVSLMIYLMFNEGWSTSGHDQQIKLPLCEEAIRLARLMLKLFPGMAESMGLLALLLLQHSRRHARIDPGGRVLSLEQQPRDRWDHGMINEASLLLQKAARHGQAGPFVIQANIAAVHAAARTYGETDWQKIESLYGALYHQQPTPVIRLNQAVAVSKTRGAEAALAMMAPLARDLESYRWFHTTQAGLLEEAGSYKAALNAYERAFQLEPTDPERKILKEKITLCKKKLPPESDRCG